MTETIPAMHPTQRAAARQREANRFAAASARLRRSKFFLAALLAFLFWFSVPYSLPHPLDAADPAAGYAQQFQGALSREIAVPLLGLAAAFMLWRYPVRGKLGGRLLPVACLYVGWALASITWSEDPQLTGKRLVVFALDCLFTYAVARTLTTMEMALGALIPMFLTGLLSVGADLFLLGTFHPGSADYRLSGVMTPNYQAMNLVACALCCAALMLRRPRWVPGLSVVLALTLAMLWLTRARVGTLLCLVLLAIALNRLLRERVRPHVRLLLTLLILAAVVPPLVYIVGNDAGGTAESAFMMGRHDTENTANLSNRLPLWGELMDSVREHPWLGYGYGAFWTTDRAARISQHQGWPVPHAHNTALDQVIALGTVGGALYLALMLSALTVAWRRYFRLRSSTNLLNSMLLTWLVLLGTAESVPLEPHMPTLLAYAAVLRMCLREDSADTADPGGQGSIGPLGEHVPDPPIVEGLSRSTHVLLPVPLPAGGTGAAAAATPRSRPSPGSDPTELFPARHLHTPGFTPGERRVR